MRASPQKRRGRTAVSLTLEKSLSRYALATASLAAVALPSAAKADFSGPYNVANWSFQNTGASDGSINIATAPSLITLIGGASKPAPPGMPGATDFTIVAVASGLVSFHWTFSSSDSTANDFGNFLLNGVPILLSASYNPVSGNFSTALNQGDVFGFEVFTTQNVFGRGMLGISNFNGPTSNAVPETGGTLSLLALGATGLALLRQRRPRPACAGATR